MWTSRSSCPSSHLVWARRAKGGGQGWDTVSGEQTHVPDCLCLSTHRRQSCCDSSCTDLSPLQPPSLLVLVTSVGSPCLQHSHLESGQGSITNHMPCLDVQIHPVCVCVCVSYVRTFNGGQTKCSFLWVQPLEEPNRLVVRLACTSKRD